MRERKKKRPLALAYMLLVFDLDSLNLRYAAAISSGISQVSDIF